jgi:hypothetical protein
MINQELLENIRLSRSYTSEIIELDKKIDLENGVKSRLEILLNNRDAKENKLAVLLSNKDKKEPDLEKINFYTTQKILLNSNLIAINRKIAEASPRKIFQIEAYLRGTKIINNFGVVPWFLEKEIRVFKQEGISDSYAYNIIEGAQNAIDDFGLDLKIKYYGTDSSVEEMIKKSFNQKYQSVSTNLKVQLAYEDYRKKELGGKPHADIVIIKESNESGLGQADFFLGAVIIWGNSKRLAKHETGHLLSIDYGFKSQGNHEKDHKYLGYMLDENCLMWWHIPSDQFCEYCKDSVNYLWKGIEDATGINFFK